MKNKELTPKIFLRQFKLAFFILLLFFLSVFIYLKYKGYSYSFKNKTFNLGDTPKVNTQKTQVRSVSIFNKPTRLDFSEKGNTMYRFIGKVQSVITPSKKYLITIDDSQKVVVTIDSNTVVAKEVIQKTSDGGILRFPQKLSNPNDLNLLKNGDMVKITVKSNNLDSNKTYKSLEFILLEQ